MYLPVCNSINKFSCNFFEVISSCVHFLLFVVHSELQDYFPVNRFAVCVGGGDFTSNHRVSRRNVSRSWSKEIVGNSILSRIYKKWNCKERCAEGMACQVTCDIEISKQTFNFYPELGEDVFLHRERAGSRVLAGYSDCVDSCLCFFS